MMKILIRALFLLVLCSLPYVSYANCTGTNATFAFGNANAGSASIGSSFATTTVAITYTCSDKGANAPSWPTVYNNWSFQTLPVGNGVPAGNFSKVFPTNIGGVGITFKEVLTNSPISETIGKNSFCWSTPLVNDPCYVLPSGRCTLPGTCVLNIQADLIKTGNISPGALSGKVINVSYYAFGATTGTIVGGINMTGTVGTTTCTIAPVTVNLGTAQPRNLTNGQPSSPKPVNLRLVCDKPPQNLSYQMSPLSGAVVGNACDGTMRNAGTGTARNAGIRFMREGANICWNTATPTNISAGSSKVIDVQFFAQMIGTGRTTSSGSVVGNAVATFTYQ
jgi:hypothetical protein